MFRSFVIPMSLLLMADYGLAYAEPGLPYASLDQPAVVLGDTDIIQMPQNRDLQAPPSANTKPSKQRARASKQDVSGQYLQDLRALSALPNAKAWMVKAAYRTIRKQKQRRLKLLDYRFADANGDGKYEVVTLSFAPDAHDRTRFVVGVYSFDQNGEPVLRFEKKQKQTAPYEPGNFTQTIDTPEKGFTLCENWRMQTWDIRECHDILLDGGWNPNVLLHTVQTQETSAHATQTNRFDFRYKTASRAYSRLPDGPFMPALKRQTDYAMIFASQNPALPMAPATVKVTQMPEISAHEPMLAGASWNDNGLYLSLVFSDVDIVEPQSCNDQISVQQYDHAELWFDLNPSLEIQPKFPETWQLEYQKNYHNAPYRHDIDADIFGIAITPNLCVVPITPSREHWHATIQVSATKQASGYQLNIFVPAAFYGVSSMSHLKRAQGLSFTARQHDRHADGQFDHTATSTFEWPDPFTFGQIWLTTPGTAFPPPFPMQWDDWLDNDK